MGDLESAIMLVLWRRGEPLAVKDVLDELSSDRTLAYTTVMTVMERLWRKGLLTRIRHGRAFLYEPATSEAEYVASLMRDLLTSSSDPHAALTHFVRGMRPAERLDLMELSREAARQRASE